MTSRYPCPICGKLFELLRVDLRDGRHFQVYDHEDGTACERAIERIPVAPWRPGA